MTRKNEGGINYSDLDKKIAALKTATREANEAIQGLREVMKDARQYRKELEASMQKAVDERVSDAVATGLESFQEALGKAIDGATEKTYARFDQITELLLGESKGIRRREGASLPEIIMDRVGVEPHQFVPIGPNSGWHAADECQRCKYTQSNKEVHPE